MSFYKKNPQFLELIETPEDNIEKFRISGTLPPPPQNFMKKVERNRGNGLYFINIFTYIMVL